MIINLIMMIMVIIVIMISSRWKHILIIITRLNQLSSFHADADDALFISSYVSAYADDFHCRTSSTKITFVLTMLWFVLMMTREWCFGLSCSAPRAWDQLLESDGFLFKNPIYKCTLCIAQSNRRTMSKLTRAYCVVSSSELNHNHNEQRLDFQKYPTHYKC